MKEFMFKILFKGFILINGIFLLSIISKETEVTILNTVTFIAGVSSILLYLVINELDRNNIRR